MQWTLQKPLTGNPAKDGLMPQGPELGPQIGLNTAALHEAARTVGGMQTRDTILQSISALQDAVACQGEMDAFQRDVLADEIPTASQRQSAQGIKTVGVVDFSIAFLNRKFRKDRGTKTRFAMIWVQGRCLKDPRLAKAPDLLGAGTVLFAADIDAMIRRHTHDGWLDEAGAYGEFCVPPRGARDAWSARAGHGTAVLDHMAGQDPQTADNGRPIYAVELPTSVLADTSGQMLEPAFFAGLVAIALFSRALPLAAGQIPDAPLVMNASLAFTGGPGGTPTPHAQALRDLMRALRSDAGRDIQLTIPVGNHLQDRIYAEMDPGSDGTLEWLVPPDDRTASTVEIFTDGGLSGQQISLAVPGLGAVDICVPDPGYFADLQMGGCTVLRVARQQTPEHLTLTVQPTYHTRAEQPLSPSGIWRITVKAPNAPWRFWIRRDETLTGFVAGGRQSRFRDGAYQLFDDQGDLVVNATAAAHSPRISREETGSVFMQNSADDGIIVVAGTQLSRTNRVDPFRFGGRRNGIAADAQAPAADTRTKGGLRAAGRFGRSTVRMAGTSMASAIHAGTLLK